MVTSVQISPDDPVLDEIVEWKYKSQQAKHLADHGLHNKAVRLDECGTYMRMHTCGDHFWVENHNRCMLQSCKYCAYRIAADHYRKYILLQSTITTNIVYAELRISNVSLLQIPSTIDRISHMVKRALRNAPAILLCKNYHDNELHFALVYCADADSEGLRLRLKDGDHIELWEHRNKEHFSLSLLDLFRPQLPSTPTEKADWEFAFHKVRRLRPLNLTPELRKLFVIESTDITNKTDTPTDFIVKETCPDCGKPDVRSVPKCPFCSKKSIRTTGWFKAENLKEVLAQFRSAPS